MFNFFFILPGYFNLRQLLLMVFLLLAVAFPAHADTTAERTVEVLSKVPGITAEDLNYSKKIIEKLDYTNMRVFRVLCTRPDMTAPEAIRLLPTLIGEPIDYEHLILFEQYCLLGGVDLQKAQKALQEIKALDYISVWAGVSLCHNISLTPDRTLSAILQLKELQEPARWAAKAFFEINGQTDDSVSQCLQLIKTLSREHCRAVETNCKIVSLSVDQAIANIQAIGLISRENIQTVRALLALPKMTGTNAYTWLTEYFSKSECDHELQYHMLSPEKKTVLLQAYMGASENVVLTLNNFHAITNQEGDEIPDARLASFSFQQLNALFKNFPPDTINRFYPAYSDFVKKGDKNLAIARLRGATAFARKETAARLSSANLYAVMMQVSILYDSSFRLILIPELEKRINEKFNGKLLGFMQEIDPENIHVANFVAALAMKARLAMFLPPDRDGQKEIIDLVTASAFKDENSLVLFAATFEKLLDGILPATRDYLIEQMIEQANNSSIFAEQIRTILQYYLEGKPKLLGAKNMMRMTAILKKYSAPPLSNYEITPFRQWLQDGKLSSLSVFHADDDGRSSFMSFCNFLLSKGYILLPSTKFNTVQPGSTETKELAEHLLQVSRGQNGSVERLFRLLKNAPLVVDLVKTVKSVHISHSVCVFYNGDTQQNLLEQFMRNGYEMYAPRGHSYWLKDHILDPLQNLLTSQKIDDAELIAEHRFLSIGACGGIQIYADLTKAFCNRLDMLGSLGAGKTEINNSYNWFLFETVAEKPEIATWKDMDSRAAFIFRQDTDKDYQLPGELPAILFKILGRRKCHLPKNVDGSNATRKTTAESS